MSPKKPKPTKQPRPMGKAEAIDLASEIAGAMSNEVPGMKVFAGTDVRAVWHGGAYFLVECALGCFEVQVMRRRKTT